VRVSQPLHAYYAKWSLVHALMISFSSAAVIRQEGYLRRVCRAGGS
jgi:hypothetical protein